MKNAVGQEVDENGNLTCIYEIPGYGTCGKLRDHLVHSGIGISMREHPFKRLLVGKVKEVKLSKRNLKRVARESGRTVRELEIIRLAGLKQGKKMTVRYEMTGDDDA